MNRITPALPVGAVMTFQIRAPLATHYRPATCDEVGCANWQGGFLVLVDEGQPLGQAQAYFIRHDRSRRYHEQRLPAGLTEFRFEPGTRCYAEHRVQLDRPATFLVYKGDFRIGADRARRSAYQHRRPADWVDQFATHQDKIKTRIERG